MINTELYKNLKHKWCWDNKNKKWRLCDDIIKEGFANGKSTNCCLDNCCLDCNDINEIAQILTQINALGEAFYSPTTPSLPVPPANDLIFAFNIIQTKWVIEQGVGIRNTETGKLCTTYTDFTYWSEEITSPTLYAFIMNSNKAGCPSLGFTTYIDIIPVPGVDDYYFEKISRVTVCLNWEDSTYDNDNEKVLCKKCSITIPQACSFDKTVDINLPSVVTWNTYYEYQLTLYVSECCKSDFVSFYISPSPYVGITPTVQFFSITPGPNVINLQIYTSPGSGTFNVSAFIYIRAGCAELVIPLKTFIDNL